jgi:hypothetical protein
MNIQSAIAASRSELVFLVKSIVQLLLWGGLIAIGVLTVFVLFPPAGVMPGHTPQTSAVQAWMLMAMMFISLLSISLLAKKAETRSERPGSASTRELLPWGLLRFLGCRSGLASSWRQFLCCRFRCRSPRA